MKKKIIVPALALLAGVSLAGSITSTVAWYQYSTRTTAAYVGVSGGTSENLQMRFNIENQAADAGWTSRITIEQMSAYLATTDYGDDMNPITTCGTARDAAIGSFYGNPKAGFADPAKWKAATKADYVVIPLQLRYVERDGTNESFAAKDVYLTDLHIDKHVSLKEDISDAIRVHFSGIQDDAAANTAKHGLFSKKGESIDTHGQLDLDSEPGNDYTYAQDKYGFKSDNKVYIDYGSGIQGAFASTAVPYLLGSTSDVDGKYLNVNVTIWVEGWQKLPQAEDQNGDPTDYEAVWDLAKYLASDFEVGFELGTDVE